MATYYCRSTLVIILALLGFDFLSTVQVSFAFATFPTRSASTSSLSPSPIVLLAKDANSKKRKTKKTGGGGGFGAVANKASGSSSTKEKPASLTNKRRQELIPLSAADTAKLNTLTTRQREAQNKEPPIADELVPPETIIDKTTNTNTIARKTRRQKWSQRSEAVDHSVETTQLKGLYTQESQQQLENQGRNNKSRLVKVSTNPLIFTIEEFIDPEACRRVQNNADGCFDLLFPERLSDALFDGQESELDSLLFNTANSREHDMNTALHYPDGLHMDTNNQCLFRHVTCILYLNDVPEECGGATVFPLARTLPGDPALAAACRLLDQKLSHTRSRSCATLGLEADARVIETRVGTDFIQRPDTDTALRIQPRAGRLLIFFSRDEKGREDPRTWHAGERIQAGRNGEMTEKRILTLFKEVDYEGIPDPGQGETTFEGFLAPLVEKQRKWLHAKTQSQSAILQQYGFSPRQ